MTSVVVDASVALKWVLNEELSLEAHALFYLWKELDEELVVPDIFLYEIAHVLYRQQRSGPLTLERSWFAFLNVRDRVTVRALTPQITFRAFEIGNATSRPDAYDAHYAALAEDEDCEYWTADERFWNATKTILPMFVGLVRCDSQSSVPSVTTAERGVRRIRERYDQRDAVSHS